MNTYSVVHHGAKWPMLFPQPHQTGIQNTLQVTIDVQAKRNWHSFVA
jgi:hypothetical protein